MARLMAGAAKSVVVTGRRSTQLAAALTVGALRHLDPSWDLRTPPKGLESGHMGSGSLLIAEMPVPDPADRVPYAPTVLLVTGLGDDLDTHDLEDDIAALLPLAHRARCVVVCDWDTGARAFAARLSARNHPRVVTAGRDRHSTVYLATAARGSGTTRAAVATGGAVHPFELAVPGRRSALTAAAVFATCLEFGAQAGEIAAGIGRSPGIDGYLSVCTVGGRGLPGVAVLSSLAQHTDDVTGDLEDVLDLVDGRVVAVVDVAGYDGRARDLGRALAVASHLVLAGEPRDRGLRRAVADAALADGLPEDALSIVEVEREPYGPALSEALRDLGIGTGDPHGGVPGDAVLVLGRQAPLRGRQLVADLRAVAADLLERAYLGGAADPLMAGLAHYLTGSGRPPAFPTAEPDGDGAAPAVPLAAHHTSLVVPDAATGHYQGLRGRAEELGLPVLTYSTAAALLAARAKRTLVVTGTDTTLLGGALAVGALAHLDPSWIVEVPPDGLPAGHAGSSGLMIVTLPLPAPALPAAALLGPVVPDVLLVTGMGEEVDLQAFEDLMPLARRSGRVVVCEVDAASIELRERLFLEGHPGLVSVGYDERDHDIAFLEAAPRRGGTAVRVKVNGFSHRWHLQVPGEDSAYVSAAVFAAGIEAGARLKNLCAGLSEHSRVSGYLTVWSDPAADTVPQVLSSLAWRPGDIAKDISTLQGEARGGQVIVVADVPTDEADAQSLGRALAGADRVVLRPAVDDLVQYAAGQAAVDARLPMSALTIMRTGSCEPDIARLLAGLATRPGRDQILLVAPHAPRLAQNLAQRLTALLGSASQGEAP
ncbi:hypothetical protein [Kitasatospora sp. NPDC088783]|uniref:hypothetical protein n=1 Tax=Kitasatospora sp. NPDC088783 TaxID=3364077 RepID=UPI003821677A